MAPDPDAPPAPPIELVKSTAASCAEPRKRRPMRKGARASMAAKKTGDSEELDPDTSHAQPRRKRQSRVAKEKPGARKRIAKEKLAVVSVDDDVCAEEMDSEEMARVVEEEEATAELEAEEEAKEKAAKGKGGNLVKRVAARKPVARLSMERRVKSSADHFVGEPVADDEARQRWPDRYKAKDEELKARCRYRAANVDGLIYQLGDDVYVRVHWKRYDSSDDTWEPIGGLRNCPERIKEFIGGYKHNIFPLPISILSGSFEFL
ncbi:hypothetical protein PR202_ga11762 [Eleusine coracana subsp. coracana]|uniref:Chromo domain-containing protein n=1 Tax=Eleusine coracana subsp. coracana TaxID=191504 RepID=A0AAV5C9T0_ELECO|nr:hypothetical protein PR202_ga11762 [Eleusine coracana subsp. coracana]